MSSHTHQSGFTIIEVMIVLAIASTLMLIVFLAVPALQGSQRDSRRKHDLAIFYDAVKEYQRNNRSTNQNPFDRTMTDGVTKFDAFRNSYLSSEFARQYTFNLKGVDDNHVLPHKVDEIVFFPGHFCPTEEVIRVEGNELPGQAVTGWGTHPRHAWVALIGLERTNSYLCLDQGNIDL